MLETVNPRKKIKFRGCLLCEGHELEYNYYHCYFTEKGTMAQRD